MPFVNERPIAIFQPTAAVLDPHVWTDRTDALNIRAAMYEPLVRLGPAATHVPVLATGWESPDTRTWTFTLRPRAVFHDGRRMTGGDAVAALDRARSPAVAGELGTSELYRTYLGDAAIDAIGEDRISIELRQPMADLLDLLAEIPIVRNGVGSSAGLAGTGPYRMIDETPGRVVMQSVPGHWAGPPLYDAVVWQAEQDEDVRLAALAAGDADVIAAMSERGRRQVQGHGCRATARVVPTTACVVLVCNAGAGACVDRRVRQALNLALDIRALIDVAKQGAARPLSGPLTELHLGYDPETRPYRYDPSAALSLLEAAGYRHGLEVIIDFPTTTPDESPVLAEAILEQYRCVGITATVRMFADRAAYAEMVKSKRIDDMACFDSTPASTYRVLREKFHGGVAGPWWQGFRNADVDRAIDEAAATPDISRRRVLYRDAFRRIRDDAPWVFLYTPVAIVGIGPRAERLPVAPQGMLQLGGTPVF